MDLCEDVGCVATPDGTRASRFSDAVAPAFTTKIEKNRGVQPEAGFSGLDRSAAKRGNEANDSKSGMDGGGVRALTAIHEEKY